MVSLVSVRAPSDEKLAHRKVDLGSPVGISSFATTALPDGIFSAVPIALITIYAPTTYTHLFALPTDQTPRTNLGEKKKFHRLLQGLVGGEDPNADPS